MPFRDVTLSDAPEHFGPSEAAAWVAGYTAARVDHIGEVTDPRCECKSVIPSLYAIADDVAERNPDRVVKRDIRDEE